MSLETAGFIKDLVPTNPEGTDPKSQGDDHLRMLKAVLKAQFPGFTDGVGVTLKEINLNQLGGTGDDDPAINIDTFLGPTRFQGIVAGCTGTLPPGGVAGVGDMLLHVTYGVSRAWQVYFRSVLIFTRTYTGSWGPWQDVTGLAVQQTYQNLTGSRALNTNYTNTTGRPIYVAVSASGGTSVRNYVQMAVDGNFMDIAPCNEVNNAGVFVSSFGSTRALVPAGSLYQVQSVGAGVALTSWIELR